MAEKIGSPNRRIDRNEIKITKTRNRKGDRKKPTPPKDGGLEIPSAALKRSIPPQEERNIEQEKARKKRRRKAAFAWVLGMALFLALVVFLGYRLMRVNVLSVTGNVNVSTESILERSGIEKGVHVFSVDKETAEEKINDDPYLIFKRIEYDFPSTLTIVVEERREAAYFEFFNACVITDETGYVLGHTESPDIPALPLVSGINITEFVLGATIRTDDTEKQSIMTDLLKEMRAQELADQISSIDLSDVNSLALTLKNGITVDLGQPAELQEKFEWLYNILLELEAKGYTGGVIDLSSTASPAYRPEQEDQ